MTTKETDAQTVATRPRRSIAGIRTYGTIIGMVLVVAALGVARPTFLGPQNLLAVGVDATVLIVVSVGLSLVMSMRGIDLSIAATADVAGYLAATMLLSGSGTLAAVFAALAVGLFVGLVNGLLAGYFGVPAIVATLGVNLLLTTAALVISSNGTPQQLFTAPSELVSGFLTLGTGSVGPVRVLLIVAVLVVFGTWFASRRTVWGRQIDLVEASARAAFLAGIPVRAVFAAGFVASGLLAALAGLMLVARTGVALPGMSQALLLEAFTAVYLGSIASPSGRISVIWTVIGVVFVSLLANGLTLLGLGAPWLYGLNGALILIALALGALRREEKH